MTGLASEDDMQSENVARNSLATVCKDMEMLLTYMYSKQRLPAYNILNEYFTDQKHS